MTLSECLSAARAQVDVGECAIALYFGESTLTSRIGDTTAPPALSGFDALAKRTADPPVPIPATLPAQRPKSLASRYTESSVYPYLETNVQALAMEFSQEPFPTEKSARSIEAHGSDTPFRHWTHVRKYIADLLERNGYTDLVEYNTTVENVEKVGAEWKVTLRREGAHSDYWWVEWFDAVVVASGHYWVPYIPAIEGLEELEKGRPGSIIHTKHFRGRDLYKGKVSHKGCRAMRRMADTLLLVNRTDNCSES